MADINTSDWTEKDGAKERSLKYVMHMVSSPLLKSHEMVLRDRTTILDRKSLIVSVRKE